ncbi:DRTGG domain-containing protein [Saccharicrinis sp. FJH2]|uniref:DRTGG domain-containing protein n=1 Tax=Saccharicrinis sp. FJH65 TaxID=3344659 RepID=UPI0035F4CECF
MKISDIKKALNLTVYAGEEQLDNPVNGGYVSDLLSDVMGNVEEDSVWITIQNHKNVVAIATLREVAAVILAKGIEPDEEMLHFAKEEGLPVLGSTEEVFPLSGKLYKLIK